MFECAHAISLCDWGVPGFITESCVLWHIKSQEIREGMDISEYLLCEKSEQTLDNVKLKERDKE